MHLFVFRIIFRVFKKYDIIYSPQGEKKLLGLHCKKILLV